MMTQLKKAIKDKLIQLAIDDKLPMDMNEFDTSELDEVLQPLEEAVSLIGTVKTSCQEGIDGTWDCSTDEGKEGFNDMITLLDEATSKLK